MRHQYIAAPLVAAGIGSLLLSALQPVPGVDAAPPVATDPGVRGGVSAAGAPLPGLTANQFALFSAGQGVFLCPP